MNVASSPPITHAYDPVYHTCTRCGAHRSDVSDGFVTYACHATPNVTAITHVILRRKAEAAYLAMGLTTLTQS